LEDSLDAARTLLLARLQSVSLGDIARQFEDRLSIGPLLPGSRHDVGY
jgi:hypothetical protein